jgi:hypothetical protein
MQAAIQYASSPDKPTRRKHSRLTKEKQQDIIELAESNPNLTHTQIASLEDCERSTVSRVLAKYGIEQQEVEDYKQHRADIFGGLQKRILKSITDEDIKKAPVGSRILAVAQLYDKERLERGQSTENVSLLVGAIQDLQARKRSGSKAD